MLPRTRIALLRRGFIMGYRAALRVARKDLDVMAANFDAEIARLENEFSTAAAVAAELRRDTIDHAIEAAITKRHDIETAVVERALIPNEWLN
jgi:hypothetical protein